MLITFFFLDINNQYGDFSDIDCSLLLINRAHILKSMTHVCILSLQLL